MTDSPEQNQPPQSEPSVLDYVKAKLMPWRGPAPEIPPLPDEDQPQPVAYIPPSSPEPFGLPSSGGEILAKLPWRVLLALVFALAGQLAAMPPLQRGGLAGVFFLAAVGLGVWAVLLGDLTLAVPAEHPADDDRFEIRLYPLLAGIALSAVAFWAFRGNRFSQINLFLWLVGLGLVVWSFWRPQPDLAAGWAKITGFFRQESWLVKVTPFAVMVVLAFALGVFFRYNQLGQVVPEMFSDHAEKLLDVYDVLNGETRIFFPRNTGREGFQFYLIAATVKLFDTGISFLSMKLGTALMGVLMLPYMYLLGKELGNKWVGLIALTLTGISFWLNILARVALRFILYPAFAAPALYYLVVGLRSGKRRYFILSGIFLGLGLHGYSPFRIVPVMVVLLMVLYWLHNRNKETFYKALIWLGIITFISLIVFLPLLRVWFEMPDLFMYRALTRMTPLERGDQMAQGLALVGVFFKNVWNGLLMFNWDSGEIWVNTLPGHPSLDVVSGALFVLGLGLVAMRYIRQRRWEDGFLLLALPVLMLPSTLALAFPQENPAPNRAGGAGIVVFVIAALALEAILRAVRQQVSGKAGLRMAGILGSVLLLAAVGHNYSMTFTQFPAQYVTGTWNTSEMGAVIEQFADTVGSQEQAWVVAYPYWADTRLVGINAGFPAADFAIDSADLDLTRDVSSPKLFLLKLEDQPSLDLLRVMYPDGALSTYISSVPTHNFYIYYVP